MKNSFVLLLLISSFASAQDEVLKVSFSGYIDTYYSYDFNQPSLEQKLPFMYNYNRQNEFNLNIGLLRAKVDYQNAYAVLSLQSGTYVDDNYANEKMKNLNEAYVGLFLDQQKKHSVEVGILPSYIGFETAVSHTNLTLTRSLLAENSPYFMTGIKYNYKPSDKWSFSGFVTNGWQRIQKPEKDISPAFGTQISYKSSSNSVVNWSTFIGKEFNGMDYTMRYFSNLYWDKTWSNKWRTISGLDYGIQTLSNDDTAPWFSPVIITQYTINSKWQSAFRAEYYQDTKNTIIATNDELKTLGLSLNLDYLPNSKVKLRTEARYFDSEKKVFVKDNNPVNNNFFLTSSLSFEF